MVARRPSGFIAPCLPSKVARPPSGPLWVHEIKRDRYGTRAPHLKESLSSISRYQANSQASVHDGGAKKRIENANRSTKNIAALAEKPLTTFNIMKRVNIKSQDECQTLLLKMRDEGAVKFDIHKGVWNI